MTRSALLLPVLLFALNLGCDSEAAPPDGGVDSGEPSDGGAGDMRLPDAAVVEPRLVVASRDGKLASLDLTSPWTLRASGDLHATMQSVHCRAGRCAAVTRAPDEGVRIFAASDLAGERTVALAAGSDPRDVAFVDDETVVVSQYGAAALVQIDLASGTQTPIDLSVLADDDGLPEANRMSVCGRRVFVQLRRMVQKTGEVSTVPAVIAVVDFDQTGNDRIVDADPNTPGKQGITLADRPDFDMPVDCASKLLWVAEPRPLMKGGGGYEKVDLAALTASDFAIDTGAEVGGFQIVDANTYWLITHTEFGPGPSSHLNIFGGQTPDTYNTFAPEHVNDLALDRTADLLYFPDPCSTATWPQCNPGVHVFHLRTGLPASAAGIDVGFPPIEAAVSR